MKPLNLFLVLVILLFQTINAQNTPILNSEIGLFIGKNYMQTDYGEANIFKSAIHNSNLNLGIAYTADFSDSRFDTKLFNFISNHSKTRIELSYSKVKFNYDGNLVDDTNPEYLNFRAMQGESKQINFGIFGEFYLFSLDKNTKLQPYFLSGISFSSITPKLTSTLALPSIFTPTSENVFLENQRVLSFSYGLGTRYRFKNIDLLFEGRFNPFLSDKVEGLKTNSYGNKNNDSQVIFNLGIIYRFNKEY